MSQAVLEPSAQINAKNKMSPSACFVLRMETEADASRFEAPSC